MMMMMKFLEVGCRKDKRWVVASSLTAAEEVVNSPQRSTLAELFVQSFLPDTNHLFFLFISLNQLTTGDNGSRRQELQRAVGIAWPITVRQASFPLS